MKIEIIGLIKEDIIGILNKAFECPWWNQNNAIEVADKLLNGETVTLFNSEDGERVLSLKGLYKGLELFISNGGSTNIDDYDLVDADYIMQYSLYGRRIFCITIQKTRIKDE